MSADIIWDLLSSSGHGFIFEKVKRYGDVPWINKPLDVGDPELTKPVIPERWLWTLSWQILIMPVRILKTTNDATRSQVTKYVAYAFKSRSVFMKEPTGNTTLNLDLQPQQIHGLLKPPMLQKTVMDESGYKVYEGAGTSGSYRRILPMLPVADEI